MAGNTFVGFGFGPIQAGLFLYEAALSGRFDRLVVAEVQQDIVDSLRAAQGRYALNIATPTTIEHAEIERVEIYNPLVDEDRTALVDALAGASEIATALPSVDLYDTGDHSSAAFLIAAGLVKRLKGRSRRQTVLYASENHNRAAQVLLQHIQPHLRRRRVEPQTVQQHVQSLNTVIGKMSGIVTGAAEIQRRELQPMIPGAERAFLVEEFNRILIDRITLPGFQRGIPSFEEKDDLLPFEEAKLYGHNAAHALLGLIARARGLDLMSEAVDDPDLMEFVRQAFLEEAGEALIHRHGGTDDLFTEHGFRAFADDLLQRMVNPWLGDTAERVVRDPRRKLAWNDRLVGTIRLALQAGLEPWRFAVGANLALDMLSAEEGKPPIQLMHELWSDKEVLPEEKGRLFGLLRESRTRVRQVV